MKKVIFSPYNILLLALTAISVTDSEDNSCPCVYLPNSVCGWQINQQIPSNCSDNFIYKPCDSDDSTDAELESECPNECFILKEEGEPECGKCLKWDHQECLEPGELSTEKLKFSKDHKKRQSEKRLTDGALETRKSVKQFVSCGRDKSKIVLEVVLILDATSSYVGATSSSRASYIGHVKATMEKIFRSFAPEFPSARFGLTYFIDYPYASVPNNPNDTCYKFVQSLTDDEDEMVHSVSTMYTHGFGGDEVESSLTAILFSAVDTKMGWSKDEYKNGKKVIKIVAVATDCDWRTSETYNSETYPVPKGDGSDTCKTGVPSTELVKRVLLENNFYVGGLISSGAKSTWIQYMSTLGVGDRSVVEHLSPTGLKYFPEILMLVLNEILCLNSTYPKPETTTTTQRPATTKITTTTKKTTTTEKPEPVTESPDTDDLYEMWMWNLIAV